MHENDDNNYNNLKIFSNINEELEFYKTNYITNIKELLKCQKKIKNLENSNNVLKEKYTKTMKNNFIITTNNKNENNLTDIFISPNEFKKLWESVIKTELIEVFDFCISEYELISNLCQDIIMIIYGETKNIINYKFDSILKSVNLEKISNNKKDEFFNIFRPFFQKNIHNIFSFNDNSIINANNKLLSTINEYNYFTPNGNDMNYNIELNNNLVSKINNNYFQNIYKSFYNICIYMLLHDPVLSFNIVKYSDRKLEYFFYNEKEFINVEGFGNDTTPCIIVLPPPLLKNKYPFNGLRPAVYCISNFNKEIISQCRQRINITDKNKENNIPLINFNGIKKLFYHSKINNLDNKYNIIKTIKKNENNSINSDKFSNSFKLIFNNYKNKSKYEKEISFIFNDNSSNYQIRQKNEQIKKNNINNYNKYKNNNKHLSEGKIKINKKMENQNKSNLSKYKLKYITKLIINDLPINSEQIIKNNNKSEIYHKIYKKSDNSNNKIKKSPLAKKSIYIKEKNNIKNLLLKDSSDRKYTWNNLSGANNKSNSIRIKNLIYNEEIKDKNNTSINLKNNKYKDYIMSNTNYGINLSNSCRYYQQILNEKNKKLKFKDNNKSIIYKKISYDKYRTKNFINNNKKENKKVNIFHLNTLESNSTPNNITSKNDTKIGNSTFTLGLSCDSNINYYSNYNIKSKNKTKNSISINNLTQNNISTPEQKYLKNDKKSRINFNFIKNNKNSSVLMNYLKKKISKSFLNKITKDDELEIFFKNYKINNSEFLKFKNFRDKKYQTSEYTSLNKTSSKERDYNCHKKSNSQRNDFDNIRIKTNLLKGDNISNNKSYNNKVYMNKIRYYFNVSQKFNKYQKNKVKIKV